MVGMKNQTLELEKDGKSSLFTAPCKNFIILFYLFILRGLKTKKWPLPHNGRATGLFSILASMNNAV
jgi:hypothetical protein